MTRVGKAILARRNFLKLTREQVSARTGGNVTGSGLGKIERGEVESPNGATLDLLSRSLGINAGRLTELRDGRIDDLPPDAFFDPMPTGITPLAVSPERSAAEWADLLIRFTYKTSYSDQYDALSRMLPREVNKLRDLLDDFLKRPNEARAAG